MILLWKIFNFFIFFIQLIWKKDKNTRIFIKIFIYNFSTLNSKSGLDNTSIGDHNKWYGSYMLRQKLINSMIFQNIWRKFQDSDKLIWSLFSLLWSDLHESHKNLSLLYKIMHIIHEVVITKVWISSKFI
jgi:hypothetical protein